RKVLDKTFFFSVNTIDGRNLHPTQACFAEGLKFGGNPFLRYGAAMPPPACPGFCFHGDGWPFRCNAEWLLTRQAHCNQGKDHQVAPPSSSKHERVERHRSYSR